MHTTIAILVGGALAALVGWQLGGPQGVGVLAGFLCGASVSGLCAARQRQVLRQRPELLMRVMAESFLFKLAMLLMGALAFRFVEAAAARVDWRSFLLSYVGALLLVVGAATLGSLRRSGAARPARRPQDLLEEPEAL
jgi:hypothetical protein